MGKTQSWKQVQRVYKYLYIEKQKTALLKIWKLYCECDLVTMRTSSLKKKKKSAHPTSWFHSGTSGESGGWRHILCSILRLAGGSERRGRKWHQWNLTIFFFFFLFFMGGNRKVRKVLNEGGLFKHFQMKKKRKWNKKEPQGSLTAWGCFPFHLIISHPLFDCYTKVQ